MKLNYSVSTIWAVIKQDSWAWVKIHSWPFMRAKRNSTVNHQRWNDSFGNNDVVKCQRAALYILRTPNACRGTVLNFSYGIFCFFRKFRHSLDITSTQRGKNSNYALIFFVQCSACHSLIHSLQRHAGHSCHIFMVIWVALIVYPRGGQEKSRKAQADSTDPKAH